jgi:hypothetical protein
MDHRSLKAEIDARQENFTMCINLSKLLESQYFAVLRFLFM